MVVASLGFLTNPSPYAKLHHNSYLSSLPFGLRNQKKIETSRNTHTHTQRLRVPGSEPQEWIGIKGWKSQGQKNASTRMRSESLLRVLFVITLATPPPFFRLANYYLISSKKSEKNLFFFEFPGLDFLGCLDGFFIWVLLIFLWVLFIL